MEESRDDLVGPDLRQGVPIAEVAEGELFAGHADGEAVLLLRSGGRWAAIGANCSHYGVSLAGGLLIDGTLRCPAHHAAFDPATGAVVRGPALRDLPCWEVEEREGRVFVTRRREPSAGAGPARAGLRRAAHGDAVVIVGAGAAGTAAATELRRQGYEGAITVLGAEASPPYDRPNVSKDFLAGSAPEEWMPLHDEPFYRDREIVLLPGTRAARVHLKDREVQTRKGERHPYDRLLLATGAVPVRLPVPADTLPHVHYLRSIAEARGIIGTAESARSAVVVGASFIGLEAAAALRQRGLAVSVVAPHAHPLGRVLGEELGDHIQSLHEARGVVFHLGEEVAGIGGDSVQLRGGRRLPAELVVVGIGVRPDAGIAAQAGIGLHHGAVVVDRFLETSAPGVFAAGDVVAWPDPRSGRLIRSEHWVVAQRQGAAAARNMLGAAEPFEAVPFFWSAHYDLTVRYVGHAERWDRIDRAGELHDQDCTLAYRAVDPEGGERTLAVATLGRDRDSLRAEAALEHRDREGLDALVPSPVSPARG